MSLPKKMRAVAVYKYLPITDTNGLIDLEVNLPVLKENDILVAVKAIAVNPIDLKQRILKSDIDDDPRILGWDGSGVIVAKGANANIFKIGDEVFFTGDHRFNGSNAQYVALNEILAGTKPKKLTFEQAAAMPLTSVTAYESIYDRLLISNKDKGRTLLIINSAGGVGSIASQMAKNLGLKVIGTASREETKKFSLEHGADVVLNHTKDLLPQLAAEGFANGVDFILVNYDPFPYWDTLMKAIKPQGRICLTVDSSNLVDVSPMKDKCVTIVYEKMSTRIKYDTEDKIKHHQILEEVSNWLDCGELKHTLTRIMSPINAVNLIEAHKLMEQQRMIGKLVLSGF